MSNADPHVIRDETQLRAAVGVSNPAVALKLERALHEDARNFIARSPFLVLSTCDADGHLDASPKGDAPGFVLAPDETTLLIPDRAGNRLVFGHLNILRNPHVGVLFMVPGTGETLRVNGTAELTTHPDVLQQLAARGKPALLCIRVRVQECFFHCAKAFLRAQLWQPQTWPVREPISFGRIFARKMGADDKVAASIDANIAADYRDNL
jgi:PPOX class probable FMN-dependent enzyme